MVCSSWASSTATWTPDTRAPNAPTMPRYSVCGSGDAARGEGDRTPARPPLSYLVEPLHEGLLPHVGGRVEEGAGDAEEVAAHGVAGRGGAAAAHDPVRGDHDAQARDTDAGAEQVGPPELGRGAGCGEGGDAAGTAAAAAAAHPDAEEGHGEDHGGRNGEAVQQHDAGDVRVLVRFDDQVIGLHVKHGQQRVAPPGNLAVSWGWNRVRRQAPGAFRRAGPHSHR